MSPRIDYAAVRPGMTVTTYSGRPIVITAARHVVRNLNEGRGWQLVIVLSGWAERACAPFEYVERCYQLPGRRTHVLNVDHRVMNTRVLDSYDDVMARRTHSYSPRLIELNTNIRVDVTV